ncbi:VanZ family protein [Cesiribacter andamanensis]|uniref:Putative integral membrane protein n=1 Tax=Cesiribacter andamanensis AMV16 TaxID=1279009 RepID=M7N7G2_9BACT|nr:VanZ family protein [Cesiribacter andamanensis]EMR04548.1 putative integral membrane protein [Cesiribacter andamanensis AMV16]
MFLRYNLFTLCWILLILLLTLAPGSAIPVTSLWWAELISIDKVVHFLIFAVLVLLMIVGFTKQYTYAFVRKHAVPLALAVSIGYGILIEVLQMSIPGRYLEFMDLVANSIGCFLGYGIFYLVYKL